MKKESKTLIYMQDSCGTNIKVFTSTLDASAYLGLDHFEFLKHLHGITYGTLPFKFLVKEVDNV
jgi:hypothetical protein